MRGQLALAIPENDDEPFLGPCEILHRSEELLEQLFGSLLTHQLRCELDEFLEVLRALLRTQALLCGAPSEGQLETTDQDAVPQAERRRTNTRAVYVDLGLGVDRVDGDLFPLRRRLA